MISSLTPRKIVEALDEHVVGQDRAKRAVAVALRNRFRRQSIETDLRDEILPKNILMIGRTGVGKTELARRLAGLAQAPFLKVEATRYTEVGYVGRDVESMVRDLVEIGIGQVRAEESAKVEAEAAKRVERKLVDLLLGDRKRKRADRSRLRTGLEEMDAEEVAEEAQAAGANEARREILARLRAGELESEEVAFTIREQATPRVEIFSGTGYEDMEINLRNMMRGILPERTRTKKRTVAEARAALLKDEIEGLLDQEKVERLGVERATSSGIIFIDEMDKIAVTSSRGAGPDVSREGVQRDLLPIVEGTTVMTKHGAVKTDHILFIASGAFSLAKPSDLIPEMQGRFPIRVELDDLGEADLARILVEPRNALVTQYKALLATEGIELGFRDEAIAEVARIAHQVNTRTENIGARRLYTVMEKLLEEILFEAPDFEPKAFSVTGEYVQETLAPVLRDEDLSKFIL